MELVKRGNERLLMPFEGGWQGEVRVASPELGLGPASPRVAEVSSGAVDGCRWHPSFPCGCMRSFPILASSVTSCPTGADCSSLSQASFHKQRGGGIHVMGHGEGTQRRHRIPAWAESIGMDVVPYYSVGAFRGTSMLFSRC